MPSAAHAVPRASRPQHGPQAVAAAATSLAAAAEAAEDAAAEQDAAYVSALARLQRWPPFLRACRVSRALGDATLLHGVLEELRRRDPARHAALAAHPGAFLRVVNRDEQPERDGTTAEVRELWAHVARLEREVQRARLEVAAASAARDAATAVAQRATAAALRTTAAVQRTTVASTPPPRTKAAAKGAALPAATTRGADRGVSASNSCPADALRYRGVTWDNRLRQWRVATRGGRGSQAPPKHVGFFAVGAEVEAARAYDDAVRAAGGTEVNFPRNGSAETQTGPSRRTP
jgi:hypothetical protein